MARIPSSTYRLQLHKGFTFYDAAAIADYLKQLGISHVYSSPYLQAVPGSMHGYDVVDHRSVSEDLGGVQGHDRLCRTLAEAGLGQVLDIVPNHMSLGEQNRYWWDVLENGASSRYASFFDIDWNSTEERLRDKVLVPILSDQYGRVIAAGGIALARVGSRFTVEASSQALPVTPQSLAPILGKAADYARSDTLSFLATSFARLPSPDFADRRTVLARHRDQVVLQGLLERLCREDTTVCEAVDRVVKELNSSADALDELLSQQHYRLAYWKTADQQLGYRRFFDVNTLIGLRVEREYVFDETHALIMRWLKLGNIDGVRVDHPDGLRDPLGYFRRLRERAPEAWIIGEKILEAGEWLRGEWPIEGTSGYDFLNVALGTLLHQDGLKRLGEMYAAFTGDQQPFPVVAHEKKINVTQEALGSDVNRLTSIFVEICEAHREERDFTLAEMRRAIREVAACFSVYRTYVVPDRNEIAEEDRIRIERATECAKANRQDIDGLLFDFMRDVLTLKITGAKESEFVYRFQQFTSPVMAKGVEDTAFYCYNPLIARNEVGGDPDCNGFSLEYFHEYHAKMMQTFPATMVTLSTHDTKRSDDVRARLAVLSEDPKGFYTAVRRWHTLGARYRRGKLIDKGTEWFLYQTIVGAWPISPERLRDYMLKAMREAKVRTSWVANNADYEKALDEYIQGMLDDAGFVSEVEEFSGRIRRAGQINSLAQTLLKHTVPGVPDLYQGGELWDLSLVDPDNRRPVDYDLRKRLLHEIRQKMCAQCVMERMDEGLPKLWTIYHALHLRREHPDWFGPEASYKPIHAHGIQTSHVIAFARGENLVTVVPRHSLMLAGDWRETSLALPSGSWTNRLTNDRFEGGNTSMSGLLEKFPVALLTRDQA
jgi:(1->4)-alpha-D-glucan 1-alpha-D-glucosylmutase